MERNKQPRTKCKRCGLEFDVNKERFGVQKAKNYSAYPGERRVTRYDMPLHRRIYCIDCALARQHELQNKDEAFQKHAVTMLAKGLGHALYRDEFIDIETTLRVRVNHWLTKEEKIEEMRKHLACLRKVLEGFRNRKGDNGISHVEFINEEEVLNQLADNQGGD